MKKFLRFFRIFLFVFLLVIVSWLATIWFYFTYARPDIPDPVYSSDGTKVLVSSVSYNKDATYLDIMIEVQDVKSGKTLSEVHTHASARMRWSIHWVNSSTFQLDSSDIGSRCWKGEVGVWKEIECP